ncbi:unnamed protein product, partial [Amoebophrya sp. A120]
PVSVVSEIFELSSITWVKLLYPHMSDLGMVPFNVVMDKFPVVHPTATNVAMHMIM